MSTHDEKLSAAYSAWKSAEQEYVDALEAVNTGSVEYDKDAIQNKIDNMLKLKNEFDLLDVDFPLPDQD